MQLHQNRLEQPEEPISNQLLNHAVSLLKDLISTPSFSGEESFTATLIQCFLQNRWVETHRKLHNVWAFNRYYHPGKPTILLSAHHDTVKPNFRYSRDPFEPLVAGDKLYGLGSNKPGGCLVSLLAAFLHFYNRRDLPYNLCFAATAEKETSGQNGLNLILAELGHLDFALVGEPTLLNLAIAEKGLMVLDCEANIKKGHPEGADHDETIYETLQDIEWFSNFAFPRVSNTLGRVNMSVTTINPGSYHPVAPTACSFTVEIGLTDAYSSQEILQIIRRQVHCQVTPRDSVLNPTSIAADHPIVQAGMLLGCNTFGSATTSDQALLDIPSVKLGPGDPARSHMADEFIFISEISKGIRVYTQLLEMLIFSLINGSACFGLPVILKAS